MLVDVNNCYSVIAVFIPLCLAPIDSHAPVRLLQKNSKMSRMTFLGGVAKLAHALGEVQAQMSPELRSVGDSLKRADDGLTCGSSRPLNGSRSAGGGVQKLVEVRDACRQQATTRDVDLYLDSARSVQGTCGVQKRGLRPSRVSQPSPRTGKKYSLSGN